MAILQFYKTILASIFKKSSTTTYPITAIEHQPLVRGQVSIDIDSCIYCGICQRKCPTHAISVTKAEETWAIERFKCILCNCCVESCPKKCLAMKNVLSHASSELTKDVVVHARIPDNAEDNRDSRTAGEAE